MNTTVDINLAGIVFRFDNTAYQLLQSYIDKLHRYYGHSDEGNEIVSDIEARIAELLQERLRHPEQAVTNDMILEILHRIGSPEDFEAYQQEEEETQAGYSYKQSYTENSAQYTETTHRKLYRDPDNRYLAGVAAGVAHYFGIPPLYARLLFVLLQFVWGLGLIAYLILWFIMPEAETTAQKLEMKGEPINLSNIERIVLREFENLSSNLKQMPIHKIGKQIGNIIMEILKGIGLFLQGILRVIGIIVGVAFAIGGTVAFSILAALFFFRNLNFLPVIDNNDTVFRLLELFVPQNQIFLSTVLIFIIVAIPLLMLVYGGIKLIFNIRAKDKPLFITSVVMWIIAFGLLTVSAIQTGKNFHDQADVFQSIPIQAAPTDTLIVDAQMLALSDELLYNDMPQFGNTHLLLDTNEHPQMFAVPRFDIRPSTDSLSHLEVELHSFGPNNEQAKQTASKIDYKYSIAGHHLTFDHYTAIPAGSPWLAQSVQLTLRIPVGQVVYLAENSRHIIHDIQNVQYMWDGDMVNHYWIMTLQGLSIYPTPTDKDDIPAPDTIIPTAETPPVPPVADGEFEQLQQEAQ